MNFTAFSQIDSLHCFTTPQVKQFLYTKVELDLCLSQYDNIIIENDSLILSNVNLLTDLSTTNKKLKRSRKAFEVATGTSIIFLLLLVLL